MVGSLISATVNHPDDYRYQANIKGIVLKEFGGQCKVHVFEMNGNSTSRTMRLHCAGFRVLSA